MAYRYTTIFKSRILTTWKLGEATFVSAINAYPIKAASDVPLVVAQPLNADSHSPLEVYHNWYPTDPYAVSQVIGVHQNIHYTPFIINKPNKPSIVGGSLLEEIAIYKNNLSNDWATLHSLDDLP